MEKNRDILKNALNDLPSKKAGESGWEHISGSLDRMEAEEFMSNNLEKLPEHKAPASAWKGIEKALPASVFSWSSSSLLKWGSAFFAGAVLISGLIFLVPGKDEDKDVESQLQENEAVMQKLPQDKKPQLSTMQQEAPGGGSQAGHQAENFNNETASSAADLPAADQIMARDPAVSKQNYSSLAEQSAAASVPYQGRTPEPAFNMHAMGARNIKSMKRQALSLIEYGPVSGLSGAGDYYRDKSQLDVSGAAFYSLINFQEVQVQNMEIPESVSSIGLEFLLEKQNLYLKSGLAYLSWEEKAVYNFEYRQNELVYSYNYVDSAHMDPHSGNINYFTSPRSIYDSVDHLRPDQVKYRYRVLQIPLVMGYKVLENRKLSFSVFVGAGGDFRIGGREYRPVLDKENSSIISEVNYLDYRFKVNWRLLGGLSLRYQLSDRWSFYLEPAYHQYLKSVYRNSGLKKVSYIEIKSGIMYKF